MHPDIHDMVFDINNSDIMYVGTDGGVYRSWNKGVTMEIVENLPLSQFYHISVDNDEPYNIYGGLQDNGSWYGPSFPQVVFQLKIGNQLVKVMDLEF